MFGKKSLMNMVRQYGCFIRQIIVNLELSFFFSLSISLELVCFRIIKCNNIFKYIIQVWECCNTTQLGLGTWKKKTLNYSQTDIIYQCRGTLKRLAPALLRNSVHRGRNREANIKLQTILGPRMWWWWGWEGRRRNWKTLTMKRR